MPTARRSSRAAEWVRSQPSAAHNILRYVHFFDCWSTTRSARSAAEEADPPRGCTTMRREIIDVPPPDELDRKPSLEDPDDTTHAGSDRQPHSDRRQSSELAEIGRHARRGRRPVLGEGSWSVKFAPASIVAKPWSQRDILARSGPTSPDIGSLIEPKRVNLSRAFNARRYRRVARLRRLGRAVTPRKPLRPARLAPGSRTPSCGNKGRAPRSSTDRPHGRTVLPAVDNRVRPARRPQWAISRRHYALNNPKGR